MCVKLKERFPGQWWLYICHKGNRTAKPVGEYEAALEAKRIIEGQLAFGMYQFPKKEEKKRTPSLQNYYDGFKESYLKTAVRSSTAERYK